MSSSLEIFLKKFMEIFFATKIFSLFLPICPMVSWMRLAINNHSYSMPFYLAGSVFNAALWLIIGILVFNLTDKYVKRNGTLSLY